MRSARPRTTELASIRRCRIPLLLWLQRMGRVTGEWIGGIGRILKEKRLIERAHSSTV